MAGGPERNVLAERAEGEPPGGAADRARRDARQLVRGEPPEEEADVRDVVPPVPLVDAAHVDGLGGRVPRTADAVADVDTPQIRASVAIHAQMLEMLIPVEQREELDDVRVPAGDVARELLEHLQ